MSIRFRDRLLPGKGSWSMGYNGLYWSGTLGSQARYYAWDEVAPGDCGYFESNTVVSTGGLVTHPFPHTPYDGWTINMLNKHADGLADINGFSHLPLPDLKSNSEYAVSLVNKTNPARAEVDVLNFLFELREIPHLIKSEGDNLLDKWANNELRREFGWKPLVNDLDTLSKWTKLVDDRFKEIKKMAKDGGKSNRKALDKTSSSATRRRVIQSQGLWIESDVCQTTDCKVSGFIRYKSLLDPNISDGDAYRLAFRSVLGLNANMSTVWNALPWTWLFDWCSNMADVLETNRNVVPTIIEDLVIMKQTTTHTRAPSQVLSVYNGKGRLTQFDHYRVTKMREKAKPELVVRLPIIDDRKAKILGALVVQRASRRRTPINT